MVSTIRRQRTNAAIDVVAQIVVDRELDRPALAVAPAGCLFLSR